MYKYPRTLHMPVSPGATHDDKIHQDMSYFINKEIVITLKMDGENSTLTNGHSYARSLDSKHHESRDWLKGFHSKFKHHIAENWRICGENLYAVHSIEYSCLDSYFYGFSIWNENNICLDWNDTCLWFDLLEINIVPVLYCGIYSRKVIEDLIENFDIVNHEGFVLRTQKCFHYDDFYKNVAKWVRPNHLATDKNWKTTWKQNKLKSPY